MQLNKKNLKKTLAVATSLLMAATSTSYAQEFDDTLDSQNDFIQKNENQSFSSSAARELSRWDIKSAILYYHEQGQVSAIEPVLELKRNFQKEDRALTFKLVLDVLSGPSPNGATKASVPQTFASPSGTNQYTVKPGEVPKNETFEDTRIAGNVGWQEPLSRVDRINFGLNVSSEYDFMSYGGSLGYQRDFNNKNTTFNIGVSYENDIVTPVDGFPTPRAVEGTPSSPAVHKIAEDDDDEHEGGNESKSKNVVDALIGVTQVFNRHMIGQLNYGFSRSSGYLNDPYKIFSVVDSSGDTVEYQYEQRPDLRMKHSIYSLFKYIFNDDVLMLSYRYMFDDWGVKSHTVDLRYRYYLFGHHYLEPHFRVYSQTSANFYSYNFLDSDLTSTQDASADYRLGAMMAYTIGLKYGFKAFRDHDMALKAEYYLQKPKDEQEALKAIILNLSYYL